MNEGLDTAKRPAEKPGTITIKKYANRRLYNTATSCYVTLDYLAQLVKAGAEFIVYDAKSGEDITRAVLTHIIVEEEAKGNSLLPVSFLRHLISFYGDSLQVLVPRYLEQTMHVFARNQQEMRENLLGALEGLVPFASFEEIGKQQIAMFERAMRMFNPFYAEAGGERSEAPAAPGAAAVAVAENQLEDLRSRLNGMQEQLNALISQRTRNRDNGNGSN
jgi:polyhydroxyalkanoate synthesis repressor PhaR